MRDSDLVNVLKACADETRIGIIQILVREYEKSVGELVDISDASQPKVSRHLAYLKRAGVVDSRKEGLNVYYRISSSLELQSMRIIEAIAASSGRPTQPPAFDDTLDVELL
jgi:ArsR family transcriptional regulator